MRHNAKVQTFGLESGPRKALLRGLVNSLVEHGRIKTTLAKAKELRRHVEPAVTLAGKGKTPEQKLHVRRLLMSRYPNENTVETLISKVAPAMAARKGGMQGGYTRILKLGLRPGDKAEMAFIEFVDFKPKEKAELDVKEASKQKKTAARAALAKRKKLRKLQSQARQEQRNRL